MVPGIIFVGGIHGVGKTQLCHNLAAELNVTYASASSLIRSMKSFAESEGKQVADVSANQDILLAALRTHYRNDAKLLLDGHFCLLTQHKTLHAIPLDTFKSLEPKAVILLTDNVEVIQGRLSRRDGIVYDLPFLTEFQGQEIEHAQYVSTVLKAPLLVSEPSSVEHIVSFVKCHLDS